MIKYYFLKEKKQIKIKYNELYVLFLNDIAKIVKTEDYYMLYNVEDRYQGLLVCIDDSMMEIIEGGDE